MGNQEYPSLNGITPSWADIQTTFAVQGGQLIEMADYAGIKWATKIEVGEQKGAGGRVKLRTTGTKSDEASVTFYRSGIRKLLRGLIGAAPSRGDIKQVSLVAFDITIQHTPPFESENYGIYKTVIQGCRLLGLSLDMKEGNDADQVEVPISTVEILEFIDGQKVALL
jgi:hypothetical protein